MKQPRFTRATGQRQQQRQPQQTYRDHAAMAGWSQPLPGARWHYFKRGARGSLCGAVFYSGGPREDGNDYRTNACKACQEMVQALRKAVRG